MQVTVKGRHVSGQEFSFSDPVEPKEIASGVHKGESKERDLAEVLQHVGQKVLRATEPMPGAERDGFAEIVVSITY